MDLMRLALSSIGAGCSRLPSLWLALLIVVVLSACATPIEPRIVEVTRQVTIEVTRSVSERVEVIREVPVDVGRVVSDEVGVTSQSPVEVIREVPVEVTRIVPREVEVTRGVPTEVVREVTNVVVATPAVRARPTQRPATATPRPIPTATRKPTDTPRPTIVSTPRPAPTPTASLSVGPPPNPFAGLFAPPDPGPDPTPTIDPDISDLPPDILRALQSLLCLPPPEEEFAELIANNNLIQVWGLDSEFQVDESSVFYPRPLVAEWNTLICMEPGKHYIVLVKRDQMGVNLDGKIVDLYEGENLIVWPGRGG